MTEKDSDKEERGFFNRFRQKSGCGCSCCGEIKIVPKEKSDKEETK